MLLAAASGRSGSAVRGSDAAVPTSTHAAGGNACAYSLIFRQPWPRNFVAITTPSRFV